MAKKPFNKNHKIGEWGWGVGGVPFCFVLGFVGASSTQAPEKSHAPESSAALAMVMTTA
jgi:hypothetical protein